MALQWNECSFLFLVVQLKHTPATLSAVVVKLAITSKSGDELAL